jgi:hypothetical protein
MTAWVMALEKLIVLQLAKKYTTFYGATNSITVFTGTRHLLLS